MLRIKCKLGEDDIRIIKVSSTVTFTELMNQLEEDFGQPVVVYQFEDHEGDRVNVRGKNDIIDAINMFDEYRSMYPNKIVQFKFFLKPSSPSITTSNHSNHSNNNNNNNNTATTTTTITTSPSTSFLYSSNQSVGSGNGANNNNMNSLSPSSSSQSIPISATSIRKGSNPPPLRTPPPSPPKNGIISPNSSSSSVLSNINNNINNNISPPSPTLLQFNNNNHHLNQPKDTTPPLRTPPGSPKHPPPLRTPPPSPPSSPKPTSYLNHPNNIGEFNLDDEMERGFRVMETNNNNNNNNNNFVQHYSPIANNNGSNHSSIESDFKPYPFTINNNNNNDIVSKSISGGNNNNNINFMNSTNNSNGSNNNNNPIGGGIIQFRKESFGNNLPRPSSPLINQLFGGGGGGGGVVGSGSSNGSHQSNNNNNGNRNSADLSKFTNFPTLIINEHEELTNLQPIRWQRGQLLGRGGYGSVYLGLNIDTGELVAVKQLELMEVMDSKYKSMLLSFSKDIEVLKLLKHENIVRYLGSCLDSTHLNVFLEYVPGGSISSLLSRFGPFSENVIKVYTKQILLGLQFLHHHQIIHRDIKGANILIDTKGTVKLSDFGCSKIFSGLVSQFKSMHGTPFWMAPEVIKQTGHGRSSDIWSLGCVIVEMATAAPPWSNINEVAAVMYHIASTNSMPELPNTLSQEAIDFLTLCFKRDPKERPDASTLLKHPFISNIVVDNNPSNQHDLSILTTPRFTPSGEGAGQSKLPPTSILSLPKALMTHLFSFMPIKQVKSLTLVCKAWKQKFDDEALWLKYCNNSGITKKLTNESTWKSTLISHIRQQKPWFGSKINQTTLKGHSKCIFCIKICGDNYILSGGEDKKLKVWDLKKTKYLYSLKGHTGTVKGVDYQLQGSEIHRIFTSSADFTARVWHPKSKKTLRVYSGHKEAVTSINYLGDVEGKIVTSSLDSQIHLWDVETGSTLSQLTGHGKGIYSVKVNDNPSSNYNGTVVSASADWTCKVWDTRTSTCVRTYRHDDDATCLSVYDNTVVSGSTDGSIRMWDISTGRTIRTFVPQETQHSTWVWTVQYDQQKIISSGKGGVIRIWDPFNDDSAAGVRTLGGHHETIFSLNFKDSKLVTSSKDKLIKLWSFDEPSTNGNGQISSSGSHFIQNSSSSSFSNSSPATTSTTITTPSNNPSNINTTTNNNNNNNNNNSNTTFSSNNHDNNSTINNNNSHHNHHHHHNPFNFLTRQISSTKLS